jgi:hypothetical protein
MRPVIRKFLLSRQPSLLSWRRSRHDAQAVTLDTLNSARDHKTPRRPRMQARPCPVQPMSRSGSQNERITSDTGQ